MTEKQTPDPGRPEDDLERLAFERARDETLAMIERTLGPAGTTDPRAALIRPPYPTAAGRPPTGEWFPTEGEPVPDPRLYREIRRGDRLPGTSAGRHASNRGPVVEDPGASSALGPGWSRPQDGGPIRSWSDLGLQNTSGALAHRCPEPEPAYEGWWFAVGLGVGVLLTALAVLVWPSL